MKPSYYQSIALRIEGVAGGTAGSDTIILFSFTSLLLNFVCICCSVVFLICIHTISAW